MIQVRPPPSSDAVTEEENSEVDPMYGWYGARFLAAAHAHPRDDRVRYVDHRRFYIRWQDVRDPDVSFDDTIGVTSLESSSAVSGSGGGEAGNREKGLVLHRVLECYYNGYPSVINTLDPVLGQIVRRYLREIEDLCP